MPRSAFLAVAGVLAAVAAGGGLVSAQTYPKPTGYVSDYAGVLSAPSRTALAARLQAVDRHRGIQIAVVTVTSLGGQKIEPYATGLFNAWGVGRAGTNTGVLVLVAPRDRQMRIEVGNGLERVLTDDMAARVIDGYFLPAFREKRVQQGIEAGVDRIIEILPARPVGQPDAELPVERSAAAQGRAATPARSTLIDDVLGALRLMPRSLQAVLLIIGLAIGLLVGTGAWLVFSAARNAPPAVPLSLVAETTEPSPTSEPSPASTATTDDDPWFLRRYTEGDPFGHEGDEHFSSNRRRDRDWSGSDRSSGSGESGGGSSSGGGASGSW